MSERGPLTIYLEPPGEHGSEGRLWCEDNVWNENGGGILYVSADASDSEIVRALVAQLAAAKADIENLQRSYQGWERRSAAAEAELAAAREENARLWAVIRKAANQGSGSARAACEEPALSTDPEGMQKDDGHG